jgi:hypothetical protein
MRSVILRNRPKNIRIHLAVSRVRFYLLRFNSSGNFCDGGAICTRGTHYPNPHASFRACGVGQGSVAKTQGPEGMSESWRADGWLGTISLSQGPFAVPKKLTGKCQKPRSHPSLGSRCALPRNRGWRWLNILLSPQAKITQGNQRVI